MEFIKSDIGVAIAWLTGVVGFIYAFLQKQECKQLKIKMTNLVQQKFDVQSKMNIGSIRDGEDSVVQTGDKNIYTKNNSGGMNIKM